MESVMTNETEAPERIWAWKWNTPGIKENGKPAWCDFNPTFDPYTLYGWPTRKHWFGKPIEHTQSTTEYTRADLSDAKDARIAELENKVDDREEVGLMLLSAEARAEAAEAKLAKAEAERDKWIEKWSQEHYKVIAQRFRAEAAEAKLAKAEQMVDQMLDICCEKSTVSLLMATLEELKEQNSE